MDRVLESIETRQDIVGRMIQLENKNCNCSDLRLKELELRVKELVKELELRLKELIEAFSGMSEIMLDMMTKLNQLEDKIK